MQGTSKYNPIRSFLAVNHRWRSYASLLAFCGLFAGCATYHAHPLFPDDTANEFQARRLDDPKLRAFLEANVPDMAQPWPRPSWGLSELTLVAFFYHPDLDVARAQWASATAAIETAGARPNPTLGVTPGYNFNASGGSSPWFPGITVDLPVETAGKRGIRINRAERLALSARLNVTTVAWQLRRALRAAMIDFTASRRRLALLQAQADIQRRIVDLLQGRQSAGAASTTEVSTVRIALTRLHVDAAEAERQSNDALSHLAAALGLPLASLQVGQLSFELEANPSALDAPTARRLALQRRSDIRAALADYDVSESELEAEIAKQYPDVHLGTGYQWDQGANKWNLALSVELPAFNRNQGRIAEAEAKRRETAARFRALQAKIDSEIDRTTAAQSLAVKQLARVREVQRALDAQMDRMQTRLAAGDIDQLEFQTAKLEAAASAVALLDSEVRVTQAAGELEDALQISFPALSLAEGPSAARTLKENL